MSELWPVVVLGVCLWLGWTLRMHIAAVCAAAAGLAMVAMQHRRTMRRLRRARRRTTLGRASRRALTLVRRVGGHDG